MYSVDGYNIQLTRGDTLTVAIELKQNGTLYTPSGNDMVRFAVKHKDMTPKKRRYIDYQPIISKVIPNSTMVLVLTPEDTKDLDFGEYVYDMQITFADGRVDTFITEANLAITPEVD